MNRLLFAAARGARIQRKHYKDHPNYWESARIVRLGDHDKIDSDYVWRIHPDDAHLAYGPVSTALRDALKDPDCTLDQFIEVLANTAYEHFHGWAPLGGHCDGELHRSLFLLILAEALADEGL